VSSNWSTSAAETAVDAASITGLDLHLELTAPGGRRAAIEDALRAAIRGGRLPPGIALPSSRALAKDLAVARGTVTEAYDQLIAEGWLVARRGSGTSVAWAAEGHPRRPDGRRRHDGSAPPRYDFRPGNPDVSAFPRQEWIAATRKALRSAPDDALRYGDPRGLAVTREALAGYVARARGVRADAARMVVCAGFVQALALLADAFRAQGVKAVAMENPSMGAYRDILTKSGFTLHLLTVDKAGADPAPLDRAHDVGATFLTPAHQYPTGTTLAPGRRAAFTAWARAHDAYLVEDDYDGEFRYDRQPVGALQGMDPERVVYVGTASKSLAPGVRLGWMVLPPALVEPVVAAKQLADRQSGAIEQLALAELVDSGAFDRHIRRSRLRYRRRRDLLLAALAPVPGVRAQGIAAGLHAVVELPSDGPSEPEVLGALAADGVAVHGLSPYWHRSGARPRGIVVGYATPPEHAFPAAVEALGAGLARLYC
jgi:GntR family transcriptional regulator/MocR family aminotransferase